MRKNRIIASLMALLMALSAFSGLCVPVYADATQPTNAVFNGTGFAVAEEKNIYSLVVTDPALYTAGEGSTSLVAADGTHSISVDPSTGETKIAYSAGYSFVINDLDTGMYSYVVGGDAPVTDQTAITFHTPEEKLMVMDRMLENATHALYVQKYTGEVACLDKRSGQILFTNPYDVATVTNKSASVKYNLMSQLIIKYTDLTGSSKEMNSFEAAAMAGQIEVKPIKGGIRIQYTLGREDANYLVPRQISKDHYDTKIKAVLEELYDDGNGTLPRLVWKRFDSWFTLIDPENEEIEEIKNQNYKDYPITKEMPIYVLGTEIKTREIAEMEEYIKTYVPDYSYDDLEEDHAQVGYEGLAKASANFKMSLEYSLDKNGMTARLPANGIRYDATNFSLSTIQVLPYIGAGSAVKQTGVSVNPVDAAANTGYIFIPDGSGSITRFEDYIGKSINVSGKIYGTDYAYHSVSGKLTESMRLPVFGIVDNVKVQKTATDEEGATKTTSAVESRGYLAIIEEGDSMVSIMSTCGSTTHKYYNVVTSFSPRQSDEYRLSDSLSVGSTSAITVESKRKYVGSLKMKFVMLTDSALAEENNITDSYDSSWIGMASAYRDYLIGNGTLSRLTAEEIKKDLPLYIETFGTVETTEKFLSIPVTVDKALTSFEQVMTMYDELSAEGVSNINFKLKGYYNGGMYSTAAYKLKWMKAAGGESGFEDLVSYAKEKDFGVYPDFDFVYINKTGSFDGVSPKKHLVKTIDNRYTSKVTYDAATHAYTNRVGMCISPSAFSYFFEGLDSRYEKYENNAISVSTLGNSLNSDFNEDDPYIREDSKTATIKVLGEIAEQYDHVMAEGGNAFTLGYIDHLLSVSLDSSRYALTSAAVPFMGVVLHGSVNFAGTPINMEGDINYALLKAIENGASLYFILSYTNNELLKEDEGYLNQYYSVRYDIWKEDVVDLYKRLNEAIGDLQDQFIVDHEFLSGERVPDPDEAENDAADAAKNEETAETAAVTRVTQAVSKRLAALMEEGLIGEGYTLDAVTDAVNISSAITFNIRRSNGDYLIDREDTVDENGNKVFSYGDGFVLTVNETTKKVSLAPTDEKKLEMEENAKKKAENAAKLSGESKYAISDGTLAKVTYENGTYFILNYNDYAVTCESDGVVYVIPAFAFVTAKVSGNSTSIINLNEASETTDAVITVSVNGNEKTVAVGESITLN